MESTSASNPITLYLLIALGTVISASCGCYNDHITKASPSSLHSLNVWMFASGFAINLILFALVTMFGENQTGFAVGYNGYVIGVLLVNSFVGIASTAVFKVS
jgi:hypothetical protein